MDSDKSAYLIVAMVAIVAIAGLMLVFIGSQRGYDDSVGRAFSDFLKTSKTTSTATTPATSSQAKTSSTTTTIPTGITCDFTGTVKPFNQGLLDYKVWSDASNPDTENKVSMSRRFSVVNKDLASQYVFLNDFGTYKLNDVVFSKLEYYSCIIPDWLYEKLEGIYIVKYQSEHVARASVMVLEDRETAVYVAQLLLALSSEDLEFKWVNGNYVAYTAQKAYWWTHDNMIIRIASHTTPMKADATGITQQPSYDFSVCETLDVIDEMDIAKCIHDQFWRDVPQDMLYSYLGKLPSDAEEISMPEQGQFADLLSEAQWPNHGETDEYQWGCDPERNAEINAAFNSMSEEFSKENQQAKTASRAEDGVKITAASTDKRWYYLGEIVTISATALSLDGNSGAVVADVNNDIFPSPDITSVYMKNNGCGNRVTYTQKVAGVTTSTAKTTTTNTGVASSRTTTPTSRTATR
jgi:hypothetical protein